MTTTLPTSTLVEAALEVYNPLLTRFLATGLNRTVQQVQASHPLVADEVRVRAWHQLSYALRTGELWPETRTLLLALAPKMEQAGFREEWIAYLTAGVAQGQEQNDAAALGELALQIAILYRMISQYETAITWLQTSLTHFRRHGDTRGQARALNEWAWVEQLRRRYAEATQYVDEAIAMLDEGDPDRGMCYRTQGMIAIYQGRWQEAEAHHRAALASFEEQGDVRKVAWATQNLAIALQGQKQFTTAIETYAKATDLLKRLGDNYHWVNAQVGLGYSHYLHGENEKAVRCYWRAEAVAHQSHDRKQLADIHTNLGLAYMAQGATKTASESFQCAIQFYEELGILSMVVNALDGLGMCYIAQQYYDQAVNVFERALAMLPKIVDTPHYAYYQQSLNKHWQDARAGQALSFTPESDLV